MNKRRMLLIGCGKAGNKLINEMMKTDSRYTGLFVNSSYNDMSGLDKFTEEGAFLFSNTNGSGKDRDLAQEYIIGDIQPLVDKIAAYPMQDVVTVFTSADGGTGSGITPTLIRLLRLTYKEKGLDRKINLVAVFPDFSNDDKVGFRNAIDFWNEIMEIKDECINDIKFIDNSKGESFTDINLRAVEALNNAYSMNGTSDEGDIDDRDARKFNTDKGFGLVLTLSDEYKSAKRAVDESIKDSVFAIPESFEYNYLAISAMEESYPLSDIKNCFENIYESTFQTHNSRHNTIVLGGCQDAPKGIIEIIKMRLDEVESKSSERRTGKSNYTVDVDKKINKRPKESRKATFTEDELNNIALLAQELFK